MNRDSGVDLPLIYKSILSCHKLQYESHDSSDVSSSSQSIIPSENSAIELKAHGNFQ